MEFPSVTACSPGRINIIGEHTDYNDGFVLPAAIDKKTCFTLTVNGQKDTVNVKAGNINESLSFNLSNFKRRESGWQNYVMGVIFELQQLGARLQGFDAKFEGNVPIGSGMSSSASLECSLAFGLNELFNLGFDKWQLIKASQMAEHNFAGIKCGIMDQFASMMGKKDQAMLLDCRSLEFQYVPLDLGDYRLLLLNTNVSHTLASSEYNTRRQECESGVEIIQKKYPEVKNLRDVTIEMLQETVKLMPGNVFNRCFHIVKENLRVLEATEALTKGEYHELGDLMYQSHFSLQNHFEVSCAELDYLVQLTLGLNYILGSRMMGGGFGGCTINIIDKSHVNAFIDLASERYRNKFGIDLTPYAVSIENGAERII